jgi:hypothetical protein
LPDPTITDLVANMDDTTLRAFMSSKIQIKKNNQDNLMQKPIRLDPQEKKNESMINKINFTKEEKTKIEEEND